ncbi:MAG: hypothetical protein J0M09_13050 [Xanthomonadales bacterium]|nr:hypothetical protein [Xanthomonadales bacterium]
MKRATLRTALVSAALVLLAASSSANAVCRRNTCYQQLNQCRATGTPYIICYGAYEDCLIRNGCQIP